MRKSLVTASLLVCALALAADKKPLVQSSTSYRPTQLADTDTTVVGAGAKTAGGTALVLSTDSRLSDSRTPTAHASTHASGGSDPLGVGSLSLSMLPSIAASTLLGNNGGVGAAPSALTASQVKTLLAIASGDVSGLGSLATKSTVNNGDWSGTALSIGNGGTGQTSKANAFDALQPMSSLGDIIYGGASGTGTRLAGNTTSGKQYLSQTGTGTVSAAPAWATIAAADISGLPTAANPSTTATGAVNNGSASTFMRSDATPLINLDATHGGTGQTTWTQGDLLYSDATNSLAKLAKNTSATRYLSNTGTSNAPAWAQVNMSNGVTNTLGVGNGGTGATSTPTDGQFLIGSSSDSVYHASTLSAGNGIAVTNGHGTATIAYTPTFRQYSIVDVTASTTTSETSITSGSTNGSKTITPPSSGILTCHIHAEGSYITSSSPPTITTRIKKGTTTIKTVAGGVMTLAASQGSAAWKLDAYLTFTSTTTVNYSEQLWGYRLEGSAGGIISPENDLPATGSVVSQNAEDIDVTVQWTSNTAGNTWRTGYYQMDCY